ncbi:MAG: pseudouridine synthase [Proteobacteria bacterium]|nr:pseudouridine synthase [Pseudomonadota bacterium]
MPHRDRKFTKLQKANKSNGIGRGQKDEVLATQDRLQKIIASTGLCSRRAAEQMILEGRVILNGKRVIKLGVKADPFSDEIKVDHKVIRVPYNKKHVYYVLNKPSGYITSLSDPFERPIVMDLFPRDMKRLIPVGRLDYNTEGILLFTDDGELVHRLTHPKYGVRRRYLVRTKGIIPREKLEKVGTNGIFVEGVKLKDIVIDDIRYSGSATWFQIEIGEGKNREIRKIVLALDAEVSRLKRIAYGVVYNRIPPKGSFRPLTSEEIYDLYKMVGLERPESR